MGIDAVKGHVDLLVLSILARREAHGYGIVDAIRVRSAGAFDLAEGTVYPALYRLERQGLVASHWHRVHGRRRRVYRLTAEGEVALAERRSRWEAFAQAMRSALA